MDEQLDSMADEISRKLLIKEPAAQRRCFRLFVKEVILKPSHKEGGCVSAVLTYFGSDLWTELRKAMLENNHKQVVLLLKQYLRHRST